mmetsp:Transcript_61933/g.179617  ORF Transcript_61933/g.179617 Transcript_61933/m.179617 type:complete len:245 (-) Transcript_61933:117-851(-)
MSPKFTWSPTWSSLEAQSGWTPALPRVDLRPVVALDTFGAIPTEDEAVDLNAAFVPLSSPSASAVRGRAAGDRCCCVWTSSALVSERNPTRSPLRPSLEAPSSLAAPRPAPALRRALALDGVGVTTADPPAVDSPPVLLPLSSLSPSAWQEVAEDGGGFAAGASSALASESSSPCGEPPSEGGSCGSARSEPGARTCGSARAPMITLQVRARGGGGGTRSTSSLASNCDSETWRGCSPGPRLVP